MGLIPSKHMEERSNKGVEISVADANNIQREFFLDEVMYDNILCHLPLRDANRLAEIAAQADDARMHKIITDAMFRREHYSLRLFEYFGAKDINDFLQECYKKKITSLDVCPSEDWENVGPFPAIVLPNLRELTARNIHWIDINIQCDSLEKFSLTNGNLASAAAFINAQNELRHLSLTSVSSTAMTVPIDISNLRTLEVHEINRASPEVFNLLRRAVNLETLIMRLITNFRAPKRTKHGDILHHMRKYRLPALRTLKISSVKRFRSAAAIVAPSLRSVTIYNGKNVQNLHRYVRYFAKFESVNEIHLVRPVWSRKQISDIKTEGHRFQIADKMYLRSKMINVTERANEDNWGNNDW